MATRPRYIEPYSLVEISCRTVGSRFLLKPSKPANDLIAGVLARAARLYPVDVVAFGSMSSHYHGLVVPESAARLAEFMRYLDSNVALELGRLHDWRQKFWNGPYSAIPVSEEPAAQIARLKYILSNSVKEQLVERVDEWPGLHCAKQILAGEPLVGTWLDHTYEYRQRRSGKEIDPERFRTTETLSFSQLPCWDRLDPEVYKSRVAELVEQAENEAALERRATGKRVQGRKAILRCSPHYCPPREKRTRLPLFHAIGKEARRRMKEAFQAFLAAYAEASARLREGQKDVVFPPGSFPPPMPFVPAIRAGPAR